MRLIDADALIKDFENAKCTVDVPLPRFNKKTICAISDAVRLTGEELTKLIADAPTVEMRPKGKWIDGSIKTSKVCSVCGETAVVDMGGYFVESFFCPNCGADMSGYAR